MFSTSLLLLLAAASCELLSKQHISLSQSKIQILFMSNNICLITLYFWSTGVHCEELTQPGSMVVRPDQSLTINCKVSYSVTSYYSAWIRQPAGKALEWIGRITSGGGTAYSDKLKNKFSISRDTGTNTITLQGQNLQTEDTAVYYCARDSHWH